MAMVSALSVVFIFVFIVILLFHFMKQYNYDTAMQMESIARTVRQPLSAAILRADFPAAQTILQHINPSGVIGHADVVLPDQFQALRVSFSDQHKIPLIIARLFDIPQQISLPLYPLQRSANLQPLAHLVLQADGLRAYRYAISLLSTLVTSWLLLSLMLSVAISWCINRLIVHPLRHLAGQLDNIPVEIGQPLFLPSLHSGDEIGNIIHLYNQQQQRTYRYYQQEMALLGLPKKLCLHKSMTDSLPALLVIHCAALHSASLTQPQRHLLLLALAEKLRTVLPAGMPLAQVDNATFLLATHSTWQPGELVELISQLHNALNDLPLVQPLPLRPSVSISAVTPQQKAKSCKFYRHQIFSAHYDQQNGYIADYLFEVQQPQPCLSDDLKSTQ